VLATSDVIYLSGISLAILPTEDRETLLNLLVRLADQGTAIVIDHNYRPALWVSVDVARAALTRLLPYAHLLFVTFEDEQRLWGDVNPDAARTRLHSAGAKMVVVKLGAAGCLYSDGAATFSMATAPVASVVDTTAAGDAFNAAFLAAWLVGCSPAECCRCGNALAGIVIQHHGALMPSDATPHLPELLAQCRPR
jgi:2-dehydro-3-deoxygluconokinase